LINFVVKSLNPMYEDRFFIIVDGKRVLTSKAALGKQQMLINHITVVQPFEKFEISYKLTLSYYGRKYHSTVETQRTNKPVPSRMRYKIMDIGRTLIGDIEKNDMKRVMRLEVECAMNS
jgi:hypothetical protein